MAGVEIRSLRVCALDSVGRGLVPYTHERVFVVHVNAFFCRKLIIYNTIDHRPNGHNQSAFPTNTVFSGGVCLFRFFRRRLSESPPAPTAVVQTIQSGTWNRGRRARNNYYIIIQKF